MAWTYTVDTFVSGQYYLSGDASRMFSAAWESYDAKIFSINSDSADITFELSDAAGSPVGYILQIGDGSTLADQLDNTNGVPKDYIATFGVGRPVTVEVFDLYEYAVVVRAASSGSTGYARCNLTFVGGYTTNAYFAASAASTTSIYVEVSNYDSSHRDFDYEIYPDPNNESPHNSLSDNYTFTNLTTGDTYRVYVFQNVGARRQQIRTRDDKAYVEITLESNNWTLWPDPPADNLGQLTQLRTIDQPGVKRRGLYRYKMTFARTGRVRFYSSGSLSMYGYLTSEGQTAWDSTTGKPNTYSGMPRDEDGGQFDFVFNCTAGTTYYLWYRRDSEYASNNQMYITIDPTVEDWWSYNTSYADKLNLDETVVVPVTLAEYSGAAFKFSCAGAGTVSISAYNTGAYVAVTTGNYGWVYTGANGGKPYDQNGNPVTGGRSTTYSVQAGVQYYVWIRGVSSESYGSCDVTITPPTVTYAWQESAQSDDLTDLTQHVPSTSFSITKDTTNHIAYTLKYTVSFHYSGTATFASSGSLSLIGYVGTQNSGVNSSTGVPVSYNQIGVGNNNFTITMAVTAGTTYYFYIKANSATVTGSASFTISVPQPAYTDRGLWVFTSDLEWRKLTPYIVVQSGSSYAWREAKGYVYTANGWGDQY